MKRNIGIATILSVICIIVLVIPSFAVDTRASDQIKLYGMEVYTGDGTLDIEFYISGKGVMDKIGCESIYLYKKINGGWSYVTHLLENYSGMSETNAGAHGNNIYIDCDDGIEYKVVVTLFAENSAGRDSRTDVFFVTG